MENNVKIKKYIDSSIILIILLWGNISAICYLINTNNVILQKIRLAEPTIFETLWTIVLYLSSGLSHYLCYLLDIEIRGEQINYHHAIFLSIQLILYYLLAHIIIHTCTIKSVATINNQHK